MDHPLWLHHPVPNHHHEIRVPINTSSRIVATMSFFTFRDPLPVADQFDGMVRRRETSTYVNAKTFFQISLP